MNNAQHLIIAAHMTPVCDCFGFTGMPILPDAGVFGSDDSVAIDQAMLEVIGRTRLIEENLPGYPIVGQVYLRVFGLSSCANRGACSRYYRLRSTNCWRSCRRYR